MNNEMQIFVERANSLIESKIILTDKTISGMLKFIASNQVFLTKISESLEEISYAKEFARSKTTITRADGSLQEKLKTPPTESRLFTFVVCLLTEFDTGKRDLIEFLRRYYASDDSNAAYSEFSAQFLKPFKHIGEKILSTAVTDEAYDKIAPDAETYFNPERVYITRAVMEQMLELIDIIVEKNESEIFFSQQEKSDAREMTTAMKFALMSKNPKLIKVIWIGFYHTIERLKSTYLYLKKLGAILTENNLI
ncbi:MAG: hypothetical protein PHI78_03390 [Clostridia bacterium]|nr:hypothetical protein [Clostridia bacterium]